MKKYFTENHKNAERYTHFTAGGHGFAQVSHALLFARDEGDGTFEIKTKRGAAMVRDYIDDTYMTDDYGDEFVAKNKQWIIDTCEDALSRWAFRDKG